MQTLLDQSIPLRNLRAIFVSRGFDLWVVGGACRDTMLGLDPKDIDLATSATPDEQVAIYSENDIRYIATGLQHGTLTVVLDQPYEITSLRTETDHDGRHATVAYTRDLSEDLGRRDLTINAMALSFDGEIIDPFGGAADLAASRVRFVGVAEERMNEDYLRILRFFRFHARFAGEAPIDQDAVEAIRQTRQGLGMISVERIWSEMSRIISGPAAIPTLRQMIDMALFEIIQMPYGRFDDLSLAIDAGITDSAALMGCFLSEDQATGLAQMWKWSKAEKDRAVFMARNTSMAVSNDTLRSMLVDNVARDWVVDLSRFYGLEDVSDWQAPVFPITGADLIANGVTPGPAMGTILQTMRRQWKDSDYVLSREELLSFS